MNDEEREKIGQKIIEEISSLKESIVSLSEAAKPVSPDNAIGRLTRLEAMGSQGISEANLRAAKGRLSRLEGALARIEHSDFGLCVECEEPIPLGRLMLIPESTRCIHCADR